MKTTSDLISELFALESALCRCYARRSLSPFRSSIPRLIQKIRNLRAVLDFAQEFAKRRAA
jgi:hypothetical protein